MPQRKPLLPPERAGNAAKSYPCSCTWPRNQTTLHLPRIPCLSTVWLPLIFLIPDDTHQIYFLSKFSFFRVRACAVVNSTNLPHLNNTCKTFKDTIQFLFSRSKITAHFIGTEHTSAMYLTACTLHTSVSHQSEVSVLYLPV